MHWASCLPQGHRHGAITSAHQRLGAAMIHPDRRVVMPLRPEPIVKPDGADNHDGARHAAQRLVATWRQDHPHLTLMVTADRLSAQAPPIETLQAHDLRYLLGVKAGDHPSLFKRVQAAEYAGRVSSSARHDHVAGLVPRLRLVNDVPLNDSNADGWVHGLEYGEMGADQVQQFSWVTDLRVSQRHVYRLRRGGRARWKIAHETCNPLKHQGDHLDHHDGHGQQYLSVVFALLMRLAFVVDQTQQRCGALLQAVGPKLGSKRLRWERMSALCYTDALESMRQRLEALRYGLKKPPTQLCV